MNKKTSTLASAAQPSVGAGAGKFIIGGDLPVHRLGFGTMRLTGPGIWGEPHDPGEAIRVLRRAVELGVNFIDTADSYGPHVSERLVAEALYPYPAGLVIATKGGFERSGPDQWTPNGRPEYLRAACEGSLRRLRLERIDLYQLHRIDPAVPAADQFGIMRDLQAEGKIRHIGLSEVSIHDIEAARAVIPIVTVQNRYSLADQQADDVVNYCERARIGFIPWFPLGAGELSKKAAAPRMASSGVPVTNSQLALAWLLWRSPVMLPIPGTSRVDHLEENIAAASLSLPANDLRELGLAFAAPTAR